MEKRTAALKTIRSYVYPRIAVLSSRPSALDTFGRLVLA